MELSTSKTVMTYTSEKTVYMVSVNTDLTEGRGWTYAKHYTAIEATAVRLARGINVQGTNGNVQPVKLYYINGCWYAPMPLIIEPTPGDLNAEHHLQAIRENKRRRQAAIDAAKAAGLSEEHIAALHIQIEAP